MKELAAGDKFPIRLDLSDCQIVFGKMLPCTCLLDQDIVGNLYTTSEAHY
jgi:hypothetical protein